MNKMISNRTVKHIRNRPILGITTLVLTSSALMTPSWAYASSLATTQVSKRCEVQAAGGYDIDQLSSAPLPYAQATACNLSAAGASGSANAEGYASASFGSGLPQIGTTSIAAQAASNFGKGEATLSSLIQYSFEILPSGVVPGTAPSFIPILFGARGAGHAEVSGVGSGGYGGGIARSQLIVDLYGSPLVTENEFSFDYNQSGHGSQGGGFDDSRSLNLLPNYEYTVNMTASCWTWAYFGSGGGSASCTAWGDPSVIFDQAAFDLTMGAGTYNLDDYYDIVFSANVVPIPAAAWLFGSGLIGLLALARRKHA